MNSLTQAAFWRLRFGVLRAPAFPGGGLGSVRGIATHSPFLHLPAPPPREYEADGSPKKYRLTQETHNHNIRWERWHLQPVGVFHSVYRGQFSQDSRLVYAWLLQYNALVAAIPVMLCSFGAAFLVACGSLVGIKPKRYTNEWMLANKERARAENSNPLTRYLDRRRKERGSNWLLEDYLPTHPFVSMWGLPPPKVE